jgi:hypothetical protein
MGRSWGAKCLAMHRIVLHKEELFYPKCKQLSHWEALLSIEELSSDSSIL